VAVGGSISQDEFLKSAIAPPLSQTQAAETFKIATRLIDFRENSSAASQQELTFGRDRNLPARTI
jgi:hypothetical protein